MKLKYVVPDHEQDDRFKFHALELYAIVYRVGQILFYATRDNQSYSLGDVDLARQNNTDVLNITIKKPADWLQVIGRLKHSDNTKKISPSAIKVCTDGETTQYNNPSFSTFPMLSNSTVCEGSYVEITRNIKHYSNLCSKGFTADQMKNIAFWIRKRANCEEWNEISAISLGVSCHNFIDALLVLTIGIEGSRSPEMAFFSFLLFDLIKMNRTYGTKQKPFCWDNAFVSGHDYHWDNPSLTDAEKVNYGGKYPASIGSTDTENFGSFLEKITLLETQMFADLPDTKSVQSTLNTIETLLVLEPQKYAHAKRGCSLIIHWLESLQYQENKSITAFFNGANNRADVLKKMCLLIVSRYLAYFGLAKNISNEQPDCEKNKAIRNAVLNAFNISRENLLSFTTDTKAPQNFQPKHELKEQHPTRYFEIIYHQESEGIPKSLFGLYWHTNVNCKLLSEHAFRDVRPIKKNNKNITQTGGTLLWGFFGKNMPLDTPAIAEHWATKACLFCFKKENKQFIQENQQPTQLISGNMKIN
ncbi:MAG: hypothetical protein JSS53_04270 [Proteobacteria bacterium]|nr:hypothetical protein [Pseudomonadota bacterium]